MTDKEALMDEVNHIYMEMEEAERLLEDNSGYVSIFVKDVRAADFVEFGGEEYYVSRIEKAKYSSDWLACIFLRRIDSEARVLVTLQQHYLIKVRRNQ